MWDGREFQIFGQKYLMLLLPKLILLTLGISGLSLYWLRTVLLVTFILKIMFMKDGNKSAIRSWKMVIIR